MLRLLRRAVIWYVRVRRLVPASSDNRAASSLRSRSAGQFFSHRCLLVFLIFVTFDCLPCIAVSNLLRCVCARSTLTYPNALCFNVFNSARAEDE